MSEDTNSQKQRSRTFSASSPVRAAVRVPTKMATRNATAMATP
jgi:hypothetical protein